jgi:hypothetical protein
MVVTVHVTAAANALLVKSKIAMEIVVLKLGLVMDIAMTVRTSGMVFRFT